MFELFLFDHVLFASSLPTDGKITAGSGTISETGNQMVIGQDTEKMVIDWQTFSIGADKSVTFSQPSTQSAVLNRVLGSEISDIQGILKGNGRVFLVNPSGVLFGSTAQVNVGDLVVSTLAISNDDFLGGKYSFEGESLGSIVNRGSIKSAEGGSIVMIAARIENTGTMEAYRGNVLLGAGRRVLLDMGGPVKLEVEEAAIDALIEQGGAVRADGGLVFISAKAAGDLASTVINHSGVTEANTIATGEKGEIFLLGDMENDIVKVGGTIQAVATEGGHGGFVETSAATVSVAESANIRAGDWLIDPTNVKIDESMAVALEGQLSVGNATVATGESGTEDGDIDVLANVDWNANTLTLTAHDDINVHNEMTATGTAGLVMNTGNDGYLNVGLIDGIQTGGKVNLSDGTNLAINGNTYTILNGLGEEGSLTGTDLQGIEGNLTGYYALGSDIDASVTAAWNGGLGFDPIGEGLSGRFRGTFDGLGHTVTGLTVNRPAENAVGLFYTIDTGVIQNLGLADVDLTGKAYVGALAGEAYSVKVRNSFVEGTIVGVNGYVGGLVGLDSTSSFVENSYFSGIVNGAYRVGGLFGNLDSGSQVIASYSSGTVAGTGASGNVGGLIGFSLGTVSDSYSVAGVHGTKDVGGLVGASFGTVSDSWSEGDVTGTENVGGLVGNNLLGERAGVPSAGRVDTSYATGTVNGDKYVGGLVGLNRGSVVDSYATGSVSGATAGGLVGRNLGDELNTGIEFCIIENSYSTGSVTGSVMGTGSLGGLVGSAYKGTITDSFWDVETSGQSVSAGGTGLTTAQMMEPESFAGWDFTNGWWISEGNTRPFLRSEYSTTISNAHQLQLMALDLGADYVLAGNIDMAELSDPSGMWDTSKGFVPVGNSLEESFRGTLDGRGHTVTGLAIDRPSENYVGLFGFAEGATIREIGLEGAEIYGQDLVGGLVGYNRKGAVSGSYTEGSVSGRNYVGGLAGYSYGAGSSVSESGSVAVVSGTDRVGGLVGANAGGSVQASYAAGSVNGRNYVGGLVGYVGSSGVVSNSQSSGVVTGTAYVGGLVGYSFGAENVIEASHSTSNVTGVDRIGGLVGGNTGSVRDSTWETDGTSQVAGDTNVGGLVGQNNGGSVTGSQASGVVYGTGNSVGGLVGYNRDGAVTGSWSEGSVSGAGYVGGLVGYGYGSGNTISDSHSTADVSGAVRVGGLVGSKYLGTVSNSYWETDGVTEVTGTAYVGGLVGYNNGGNVTGSSAQGNVSGTGNLIGGLVGYNISGTVTDSHTSGTVGGTDYVGGLVGYSFGTGNFIEGSWSNSDVHGTDRVGGLVGTVTGTVTDSYWETDGTSAVTGSTNVGGLAGYSNGGSLTSSGSSGTVTGTGNSVGGLVGFNRMGSVTGSHSDGLVSGASYVGGLVGYNYGNPSTVADSYSTSDVSGEDRVGGLVGANTGGTVEDTYATGNVSGRHYVGGAVGYNSGVIDTTYSTGSVTGTSYVGGLVGRLDGMSGPVTNSYWDTVTSGQLTSAGGTGLTTSQMMQQASFAGWDFENTWWMSEGNTRPFLRSEYSTEIANAHELQLMALDLDGDYTLVRDIDMGELSDPSGMWNTAKGFVPVGKSTTRFTGSLDGRGNAIEGLKINRPNENYVGMFGATSGALIQTVQLEGVDIAGGNMTGSLIGSTFAGIIRESYSNGIVHGAGFTGGLIGRTEGLGNSVVDCLSETEVTGTNYVGGLVGYFSGNLDNGTAKGKVSGTSEVGGLVGRNDHGTIRNSYAQGEASASGSSAGGLLGINLAGTVDESYATGAVFSGQSNAGGLVGYNDSGVISKSYASGTVTGANSVGGLVGWNQGQVGSSYATGSATGTLYVGGLVGYNSGVIDTTYSTGSVTGTSYVGGLVGRLDGMSGPVTNSYWDTVTSGQLTSAGGTGLTTSQMMQQASFAGWDISNDENDTKTWIIYENLTAPLLRALM